MMQNAATMINACLGDVDVALTVLTVAIAATLLVLLAGVAACVWSMALSDHDIRKQVAQRDLDQCKVRSTSTIPGRYPTPPPNPHRSSQVPPKPMLGDE